MCGKNINICFQSFATDLRKISCLFIVKMSSENIKLEVQEIDKEDFEEVAKLYEGSPQVFVRLGPKGYYLPKNYLTIAEGINSMELRPEDIFVVTYQRAGTTLTQELVWILANDLNYEKAAKTSLMERYCFLEHAMVYDATVRENTLKATGGAEEVRKMLDILGTPASQILAKKPSPRFVKTHQPMSLLPPKLIDVAKVVYVARDPRDVAVSSFHQAILFKYINFKGTFKDFWNIFVKDLFVQTPFFEHVKEAWNLRNHPNMLFMFYEDITKDLPSAVRRVAEFLGNNLTQEQVDKLSDHLSFENFKKNPSVNYESLRECGLLHDKETFIRKGKVGGWRDYFDEEMYEQTERWVMENLQDTDLRFPSMKDIMN